jgi:hypothetical protein
MPKVKQANIISLPVDEYIRQAFRRRFVQFTIRRFSDNDKGDWSLTNDMAKPVQGGIEESDPLVKTAFEHSLFPVPQLELPNSIYYDWSDCLDPLQIMVVLMIWTGDRLWKQLWYALKVRSADSRDMLLDKIHRL